MQSMLEPDLILLYEATWQLASDAEREALRQAAGLQSDASPTAVFTTIAQRTPSIDPTLTTHLWHELNVQRRVYQVERDGLVLSQACIQALEMALAYELGRRIDGVLADLPEGDFTQEELEERAAAGRVDWRVIAYARMRPVTTAA